MSKILIFGDSIARGAFDEQYGGRVEMLKGYYLGSYTSIGVGVYNMSVSSNDSRGVLATIENDIKKIQMIEQEDLIIIFAIGTNDCMYPMGESSIVPVKEFEENILDIIRIAKKYSDIVIFTGGYLVDESLSAPWRDTNYCRDMKNIQAYDCIISNVAEEHNCKFIDTINVLSNSDLSDGIHPNTTGHQKIYECVRSYLDQNIFKS